MLSSTVSSMVAIFYNRRISLHMLVKISFSFSFATSSCTCNKRKQHLTFISLLVLNYKNFAHGEIIISTIYVWAAAAPYITYVTHIFFKVTFFKFFSSVTSLHKFWLEVIYLVKWTLCKRILRLCLLTTLLVLTGFYYQIKARYLVKLYN